MQAMILTVAALRKEGVNRLRGDLHCTNTDRDNPYMDLEEPNKGTKKSGTIWVKLKSNFSGLGGA